jgi:hypothetical protein
MRQVFSADVRWNPQNGRNQARDPLSRSVDGLVRAPVAVHVSRKGEKAGADAGRGISATRFREREVPRPRWARCSRYCGVTMELLWSN